MQANDINILENYQFRSEAFALSGKNRKENDTLLCVKTVPGKYSSYKTLGTVKRSDVTKWEVFKSYFGCGKLADCDLNLKSIAEYLHGKVKTLDPKSKAYKTVHEIATRMLVYRKDGNEIPEFWKSISTGTRMFAVYEVERATTNRGTKDITKKSFNRAMYLTPLTTIKHLAVQADIMQYRPKENKEYETTAKAVGGLCEDYSPWYKEIPAETLVTMDNLKNIWFNVITAVSYSYYSDRPIWGTDGSYSLHSYRELSFLR